jgi:hypothetical protein
MRFQIKFGDKEYNVADISDEANGVFELLQFATLRIQDLKNMEALLTRAKLGYTEILQQELLSDRSGFMFDEE